MVSIKFRLWIMVCFSTFDMTERLQTLKIYVTLSSVLKNSKNLTFTCFIEENKTKHTVLDWFTNPNGINYKQP